MKKLLLLILSFSIKLVSAQESNMLRFGVKLMGGSATLGSNYSTDSQSSITTTNALGLGVFADYGITEKFYIQPGVSVLNKGYVTAVFVYYLDDQNNYQTNSTLFSYKPIYIEIPVNAVLKLPLGKGNVHLGGGPYFAYAVGGKVKEENFSSNNNKTGIKERLKIGNSATDNYAPIDYGLNFLVGYQLKNGLFLEFNFAPGLANIIPKEQRTNDVKSVNGTGLFNLGFEF